MLEARPRNGLSCSAHLALNSIPAVVSKIVAHLFLNRRAAQPRPHCALQYTAVKVSRNKVRTKGTWKSMFKLVTTMKRGSSSSLPQAWARYASVELARAGGVELLREDRVLRVMIVRNEIPQTFVEWLER
jgi:hypothetical protein